MFSIADRHHDKNNVGKSLFGLHALINVCHLGKFGQELKQELRQKTKKSGYCFAQLTYTTSDQFDGVKSPMWVGVSHVIQQENESCDCSPTAKSQAYLQMLNTFFVSVSYS